MIDYWKLTKDFAVGDTVQRFAPGFLNGLSPFVGAVQAVHRGIGFVDVQWPYGVERVSPEDLVKVNPDLRAYLPPTLNQMVSSFDVSQGRVASKTGLWRTTEVPAGFHRDLAKLWAKSASDLMAYDSLWQRYAHLGVADDVIRDEVGKFYAASRNLADMRVQAHARRTAAYWVAQNRQYRVTQDEMTVRKPLCPKCGTKMRRTTYKMDKGARMRLWACPKDLFLIKQSDVLSPSGETVDW